MGMGVEDMSLVFNPRNHTYRLDGKRVPGVTTLIGKGLPKPALVRWAAKSVAEFVADNEDDISTLRRLGRGPLIEALKATPWQTRDDAALRGTDIHTLAEGLVHGESVDVPAEFTDAVAGYVDWLDTWNVEPRWTERPVANRRWWYAGKPDIVCTIGSDTWLLDWKTSKGVYGDHALQVCAYGHAEFSNAEDGSEEPMPHIDRYGVVHIERGETRLYEVSDPESAWKDFLHCAWTANAEERIKGYLGEITRPDMGVAS